MYPNISLAKKRRGNKKSKRFDYGTAQQSYCNEIVFRVKRERKRGRKREKYRGRERGRERERGGQKESSRGEQSALTLEFSREAYRKQRGRRHYATSSQSKVRGVRFTSLAFLSERDGR